jgi:signal transduction histidine kinase
VAEETAWSRLRGHPWSLFPWAVLAAGIPTSMLLALTVRDTVENVASLRFEREASDAKSVIEDRIHSYADVLYGLKAQFASLEQINRLQFHRFVESLDLKHRYPGFDVVNYAVYVPGDEKQRFEQSVRNDRSLDARGYPGFAIRPAGTRPEYWVIAYVEPMVRFEFAFGLDLGANPEVADSRPLVAALRSARDSGNLTSSGVPLKLLSRRNDIGLAMRLAVYRSGAPVDTVEQRRAAYRGSVGAGFNVASLLQGVLAEDVARRMRFRLSDVGPAGAPQAVASAPAERVLFDSNRTSGELAPAVGDADSTIERTMPIEVGGRLWRLRFSTGKDAVMDRIDQRLPMIVLGTGLLVTMLLFAVLYSLASSRSRAMALAQDMTRDLQASTAHLQAMSRRLVDVQEAERRHFSREFHDQIGQNLTALGINIDILKTELAGRAGARELARLDDLAVLTDATASAIDDVISDLRPPMLDDYGLLPALQWYGSGFAARTGIRVEVKGGEQAARLSPAAEIGLFRIVQEALNNVAKHARASAVDIGFELSDNRCSLSITDNGVGQEAVPAPDARRHGLGMVTMRERTQALAGEFAAGPTPQGGFRVAVSVPC